jgi:hypothetical protein
MGLLLLVAAPAGSPLGEGMERLLICHGWAGPYSFCLLACRLRSVEQVFGKALPARPIYHQGLRALLAQPIHRHGGAGRQRQPGPLPRPAQAEEGLWGDRGRTPSQFPRRRPDQEGDLGAAAAQWHQPSVW